MLNDKIIYPEFRLTLKSHKSRKPNSALMDKIGESLELARTMTNDALVQLTHLTKNPKDKDTYPTAWAAAEYHLKLTDWDKKDGEYVRNIMEKTASGLNAQRSITISDVLSPSIIDLYKVYLKGLSFDQARIPLRGQSRPGLADVEAVPGSQSGTTVTATEASFGSGDVGKCIAWQSGQQATIIGYRSPTSVTVDVSHTVPQGTFSLYRGMLEGYVVPPDARPVKKTFGSIHVEFSLATIYPKPQIARAIIHEATHKFADTQDVAYCYWKTYPQGWKGDKIINADSYTYVVLSIYCKQLIKDLEECFRIIPQDTQ